MKRFFVEKVTNPPVLRGEAHKHLTVVRAKAGEEIVLCEGDGFDHVCRIEKIGKSETELTLVRREQNESEPSVEVTLFSAVMKGDKNDFVVQKATELGASEIYPVITRYVQGYDRNVKTARLKKIALEAAQQSGRAKLPDVHEPVNFVTAAELTRRFDLVVFPYEKAEKPSLKELLESRKEGVRRVAVWIGPEGGFSEKEVAFLTANGFVPVTLGKRILRAETANVAVLSAVMYALDQWK